MESARNIEKEKWKGCGVGKSRREMGRLERSPESRQTGKGLRFLPGKSRKLGMEKPSVGLPPLHHANRDTLVLMNKMCHVASQLNFWIPFYLLPVLSYFMSWHISVIISPPGDMALELGRLQHDDRGPHHHHCWYWEVAAEMEGDENRKGGMGEQGKRRLESQTSL